MKLYTRQNNRKARLIGVFLTLAALIGALVLSPLQAPVVLFKLSLVTLAAVASYWIDKILNPHLDNATLSSLISKPAVTPDEIKERDIAVDLYRASMIRRALITFAVVIGVCLGL